MEKINQYLNDIAKEFGYEFNDLFFSYLKSISKSNNQVCNKRIPLGEGGWKCLDCEMDIQSIICNYCYSKSKEKHKGHKIFFDPEYYGFCDCGDPNTILPESFCTEHQGPFKNYKDLTNFIKSSFNEQILSNINIILNNMFNLFIEKMKYILNKNENEEDKNNENELFNILDKLIDFCFKLYDNNLGLFYFVTLKFTENFPFETNHNCFNYNEENNQIIIIKESQLEKHSCICPFFQVLINILMINKSNYDSENFYTLFIQNYKNKLITSLTFLHSFIKLFDNDNLKVFRGLSYQLLNDEVCELLVEEKNMPLLENLYLKIYINLKNLLNQESYEKANDLLDNFYDIIRYIPKIKIIEKIRSHFSLYNIVIDIMCLINNFNKFENKTKFTSFQREGYSFELLIFEYNCLLMANTINNIIDYDKIESVKFIFNKIISKLKENKINKESSPQKFFTPHIVCIRYFSIFLNRFCFNYAINNHCDLLDSFNYFQSLFPEIKELYSFLFKELITFFGFCISQKYSFFIYYGEGMKLYHTNYFSSRPYIGCDIALMKYLLTLPEIQNNLINNILEYTNIDSSNDFFIKLKDSDLKQKDEDYLQNIKMESKNLKYINDIFYFILQIIRNNDAMINLAFKYSERFRMKYKDNLLEKFLKKEMKNFENILKNQIIHLILGNGNIVKRESCVKLYTDFAPLRNYINIDFIDNILKEKCDIISSPNQLKHFSLKKNIFQFCDIDYIISSNEKEIAINYLLDFKENEFNILNTFISDSLLLQEKLDNKIYENFFSDKNIILFLNFYEGLICNSNYPLLTDTFFYTCSKIVCLYIKINKEKNINEEYKNKITEIINNNKLEGNNLKLIKYINRLLFDKDEINEIIIKEKKKSLKEKYKKKFDKQNQLLFKRYSSSVEYEEEDNILTQEEICIYCRQPLNNDINNYYGKICYLFRDFFIDILKHKEQKNRMKSTRIVTCNHKIHFNCYCKYLIQNSNNLNIEFSCLLCKKLSNILICDFNDIIEKNKNILKGMIFEKENINDFYKINNNIDNDKNNNNTIDINKYSDFLAYNNNFFETYCSKLLKKNILVKDINADMNLIEHLYKFMINDFDAFTIYYNITNYKKDQIDIWKNILLTIRLLCKYKIINSFEFFINKFKYIYNKIKNLDYSNMNNCEITSIINEFIFCFLIIYDLNEENKEKVKNIFKNYVLIFMFIYYYIKNNETKFEEFLLKKDNQELIKIIFDLYYLKYKIFFLIYGENEENINILNFEETIQFLKEKYKMNYLINNCIGIALNGEKLFLPEFNIIELPDNFMEFCSKYMNINCINCNKKNEYYEICLICGNKLCDNIKCITEIKAGKKEYSLIAHSKICGGGSGLLISNKTSEIYYILKSQYINSKIYVYLNSFGEYIKDYSLNDNYILNQVELKKAIQKFIDVSFRIKGFKIKNITQ